MKLAILSPIAWRTPPRHYGPWERVVSLLGEGLVARGVEITLFATGDSITKGKLEAICPAPYEEDKTLDPKVWEGLHIAHLFEQAEQFDLIHNHTVYHGIDLESFTLQKRRGDYLLFFGRIHADKGTAEAIQIAQRFGMKLIIAGIIQDPVYFKNHVEPFLNSEHILYVGSAGPEVRDQLLGGAYALLHPINFPEPFGSSVIEAMACGTPVIAFARGSMPEIIKEGETGFLVNDVDAGLQRLYDIPQIDRSQCRRWVEARFSQARMVEDYLAVYRKVLSWKPNTLNVYSELGCSVPIPRSISRTVFSTSV